MEKAQYAEAEPLLVFFSVTNHGKSDRPVARTLYDGPGLLLFSLDGGRSQVAPSWVESSAGGGTRANLAAGETVAGVRDLLTKYGEYRRGPGSIADRLGLKALSPGRYRLIPSLVVDGRNGDSKSYEFVEGDSLEFTIVPLANDITSAQLIGAFLKSASWKDGDYGARMKYCAEWAPRFYSSGFLPTLFLASGSNMRAVPLDALLGDLRAHGASDLTRAEILQMGLTIDPDKYERKRKLLEKIAQDEPTGATAAVIKTWAARMTEPDDARKPPLEKAHPIPQPAPTPVKITVSRTHPSADWVYSYTVHNGSEFPISAIEIGFNGLTGDTEPMLPPKGFKVEAGVPPEGGMAPSGWHTIYMFGAEGEPQGTLRWESTDADHDILGGQSRSGFVVTLDEADSLYEHSHWTARLSYGGPGYYAGSLEPEPTSATSGSSSRGRGRR